MYLKSIAIKNIGPICELSVQLPFNDNGNPKPIVFVGENGSGKTILQSQIIDSLYEIGSEVFEDIARPKGLGRSFYKISGGTNLKAGETKGFSILTFFDNENNKIEYFDKVGETTLEDFKQMISDFVLTPENIDVPKKITTISNKEQNNKLQKEWLSGVYFYQPAYRYEEPFWKNNTVFEDPRYEDKKRYNNQLNKEIEIISSNKENKSYLLDLVLDFEVYKREIDKTIWENVQTLLRKIKKRNDIRFGIGPRGGYRVSIIEQNQDGSMKKQLLPSIDNLSLGELIIFNLFLNIIRHSDNPPRLANKIEGIVAIDEIDVHLHADLQNSVLPELIRLFPKIQFIITTHSPLFLLGMRKVFGDIGFEVKNMPNGQTITAERFSEFEKAYDVLKDTEKFEYDLEKKIIENNKPRVYVEGPTDARYIKKAFELFDKTTILQQIEIEIIGDDLPKGTKHSNNVALKNAEIFLKTNLDILSQKIMLLNDPEEKIRETNYEGKLFVAKIPKIDKNPLTKGIENLFNKTFINKVKRVKNDCFQSIKVGKELKNFQIVNGKKQEVCQWICTNGIKKDFSNFLEVIEKIEKKLVSK